MKRINVQLRIERDLEDISVTVVASEHDEQVETLMARIADPLADTLIVLDEDGVAILMPEGHIISVSAEKKRVKVVSEDGDFWMRTSLQELEHSLNPTSFLRISRYEIVNLNKVRRFDFSISGTLRVEMTDGSETWASRRYIRAIRERLQRRG